MKRFLLIALFLFGLNLGFSQTNDSIKEVEDKIYILFDIESKLEYSYENGSGSTETSKVFVKEEKNNGEVDFFIKKELLKFYNNKKELDTICLNHFKDLKFSIIEELRKIVDKKNQLYPYKIFNNIILIEKLSEDKYLQYRVRWEFYIE
ncbi:MAG: hypothetical protein WBF67_12220 [Olleya sp.]